jgi:hypothetical protein
MSSALKLVSQQMTLRTVGWDNVERTDVVNFSPGRSNFPPNFFRTRKLRNFRSDILSTGKFKSNKRYQKIQVTILFDLLSLS